MDFNLAEKLAIVKVIDSVIHADGIVHHGEINALSKLMGVIDFDSNFMVSARILDTEQSTNILKQMSEEKKNALARILEDMAKADGFVHQKETALMVEIFTSIGIFQELP